MSAAPAVARKKYTEDGPPATVLGDKEIPAVVRHNLMSDIEPESGPLSFRREKRLEDLLPDFTGNSNAGVYNPDDNGGTPPLDGPLPEAVVFKQISIDLHRADMQSSTLRHRLNRIKDHIQN